MRTLSLLAIVAPLVTVYSLGSPHVVHGQTNPLAYAAGASDVAVGERLRRAAHAAGLEWTHKPHFDWLHDDELQFVSADLIAGVTYYLVGVCDEDCADLDLALHDDQGNLVKQDVRKDAVPVLEVRPRWSGTFHLMATMRDCAASPCRWGVGVFRL